MHFMDAQALAGLFVRLRLISVVSLSWFVLVGANALEK